MAMHRLRRKMERRARQVKPRWVKNDFEDDEDNEIVDLMPGDGKETQSND